MNNRLKRASALLLAGTMLAGCAEQNSTPNTPAAEQLSESVIAPLVAPVYPEMAGYPDEQSYILENGDWDDEAFDEAYTAWNSDRSEQREKGSGVDYSEKLDNFFRNTAPDMLKSEENENRLFAPANVYMALSLLSEITDGDSRNQILSLLGTDSVTEQRDISNALWNANYCSDGAVTSTIANSLWLRSDSVYNNDTLKNLADNYYAYSFSGEMGSAEYDETLQNWVDTQTGGLLTESAKNLHLDPSTVISLVSTMYFRAKWTDEFLERNTYSDTFHSPNGDTDCDFMHSTTTRNFYYTDGFNAIYLGLTESGGMWLVLPDEGKTTDDVLENEKLYDLIENPNDFDSKRIQVNLSMPKFDVNWSGDISEQLRSLGVTDVFDGDESDFSPLCDESDGLFVSGVQHSVRVAADEEGVTAAAFTMMAVCGTAMPPDEIVDFNLNRPFIFVITGDDNTSLFAGVVNNP